MVRELIVDKWCKVPIIVDYLLCGQRNSPLRGRESEVFQFLGSKTPKTEKTHLLLASPGAKRRGDAHKTSYL